MPTLTPQQRKFLGQRLKVKQPQKKGFFSSASKDEKSDEKVTKRFGKLLDDVTSVKAALAKLAALLGSQPDAQKPIEAFQARLAAVDQKVEKSTDADAEKVFKDVRGELATLLADIAAAVKKQEADPKSKSRGAYAAALAQAERQLALLQVIPNADTAAFAKMVQTAKASAAPDSETGYRAAVKDLAGCDDEFKRVKAAAAKSQKSDVAQSAKKPDALTALAAAAAEFETLSKLPGLEATAAKFEPILKAAQDLAAGNRFADALKELAKLKTLPTLADSVAASGKAVAGLKGNKGYDDGMALLAKLKELVSPKELAAHEQQFQAAVKQAVAAKQAAPDLGGAAAKLQQAFDVATQAKTGITALLADLDKAYAEFKVVSSKVDVALVDAKIQPLKAAQAAKDHATASRMATELLGELNTGVAARKQPYADWQKVMAKPPLLVKEIDLVRNTSQCKAVRIELLVVMNKVAASEVKRLSDAAEWARLAANVTQTEEGIVRLKAKEVAFGAFQKQRDDAQAEVKGEADAVRAAIKALDAAVAQAAKASGAAPFAAVPALASRLVDIENVFAAALAGATNDAELKLEGTRTALAELSKAVMAAATPAAIQDMLKGNAQKVAQADFDKNWAVVQAEIVKLQGVDNQAAATASGEADAIRQGGGADWQVALGALTKLSSRLVADRAKLAQGRDAKAAAVAKTVKDTTAQIAALKKATGSSDKFGPFFEALQQECDQLALLGESPNGDAVAEAEQGLKDMQARIKKFSPEGAPKGGATLDSVTLRLTASEKALKTINDTLAKNCPKTLAKLNKDLAALRTALAKQEPQASITALDAFDAACKAAEGDAAKVIEVRTEFEQLLPSVQVAAAAFTKQQAAPDYAKALTARIEDAVKQAKKADDLYAALQKLNAVDEELKDAALKPGAALAKEGQIRQKAQADAAAKAEWQRSVALFESKRLPDVEAAVSAGGTKGLVDELKNMLKAAKQTADKGDAAQALKQLKLADARAGEIIAAPQGAGIGARNDLPADAKVYGEAVSALRDLLSGFPQQVAKAMPALPPAVTQRLGERVGSLAARFDPASFDTAVLMLAAPDIDDKERRARREAALAQVRSTRSLFTSHPLMASLAKSPIASGELSAALRRIDNSLNRLDANISRSTH